MILYWRNNSLAPGAGRTGPRTLGRVSDERPLWRQAFDALDGAVGPRLMELVNSEGFAVAVGLATRTQSAIRRQGERTTRRMLHLWNLPAGSDVTRILNELGSMQQQVRDLTRQLNAAKEDRGNGAEQRRERPAGASSA